MNAPYVITKTPPRELALLALGTSEPDADCALYVVLDILQAEAKAVAGTDSLSCSLVNRIEALKVFVDEHMTVSWADPKAVTP